MKWLVIAAAIALSMPALGQPIQPSIFESEDEQLTVDAMRAGKNDYRFVVKIPPGMPVTMWQVVAPSGGTIYATRVVTESIISSPLPTSVTARIPEDVDDVRIMIYQRGEDAQLKFVNLVGR